jgi:hypothetical protein
LECTLTEHVDFPAVQNFKPGFTSKHSLEAISADISKIEHRTPKAGGTPPRKRAHLEHPNHVLISRGISVEMATQLKNGVWEMLQDKSN